MKEAFQQELMRRFKEKEEIRKMKEAYQQEMIRQFKEREKMRQIKEAYQQELMRRLKENEELHRMKEAFLRELMTYHRKKQEDKECFVPRKLFLFNIDTFICPQMISLSLVIMDVSAGKRGRVWS
ncbi:uncharacterized protein PF3D7_1120000-like [Crassostrea angulata]|uniref:uncharacterized protein PF3D7_1120000-like n=1 Tax=Magallana angulata TaxID=2784310 RepID=UPI0022B1DE68|nr:uncharacterized protein PF3D7_1120000-like [Crassostrea angulata]